MRRLLLSRRTSRPIVWGWLCFLMALAGCSGPSSTQAAAPSISITAPANSVSVGKTLQLTANVTQSSSAVAWSVSPGGGTISASGLYSAPASLPTNPVVIVTAQLVSTPAVSANLSVTLLPQPSITVTASSSTVATGATLQLSATITGTSAAPVWTVDSGAGTISSSGLYTAPSTLPANTSVTLRATLSTDSTISDTLTVTIVSPAATISISAPSGMVGLGNTMQFSAIIGGSTGTATWSVSSGAGTISSNGLYTAPSTMPSNPAVTVTAAVSTNIAISSSRSITISALPTISSITPGALPMGENNRVTVTGTGFVSTTQLVLNGSPVPTTFQSPTSVTAALSAEPGVASPLTIIARNPPSGGSSAPYLLPTVAPSATIATIGTTPAFTIPKAFLGLSHEWGDAEGVMGQQSQGTNNVYRKLVGNLMDSPTSPFLIRIGGGSTDGATTPFSVQAFNELNAALPGITFTAGVYMGGTLQSSPSIGYAEMQAQAYVSGMTPGILSSIEIGNETDNYQYIKAAGRTYTFDVFNSQFAEWVSGIKQTTGSITPKFTGGSWALMRTLLNDNYWSNYVNEPPSYLDLFIDKQKPNLGTVTQHFYGGMEPGTYPPSYLLNSAALQYLNPGENVPYWVPGVLGSTAALAHQNGMTFRVNEMNSIDGGGVPGTSDSFAATLWAIDTMFEFANAGVDGVNWHGATGGVRNVTPGSTCTVEGVTEQAPCTPDPIYAPFTFFATRQTNGSYSYSLTSVNPLYYALYFFHLTVPDGSQLLPVTLQSPTAVKVWATKDASGTVRIAVINKDTTFSGTVSISLAGYRNAQTLLLKDANGYQGTINYATSSSIVGTTGITIAGQTFDGSTDGSIQGTQSVGFITPVNGVYDVPMQPATAMLLVIPQ